MTTVATTPQKKNRETSDETAHQEYRTISLAEILESKTNPRRKFNASALDDLTESIKQMGVLEPLLVRASQVKTFRCFEIVSGARRYRASKAAGLASVPCRVMELTDRQVLEVQVVENLQRDDLHPLEEARGYEALMAAPHRMTALTVAAKIGMSEKYVYDRVKLLQLISPLNDAFWAGRITAGHAIILARIPDDKQALCLDTALFETERTLFDPHDDGDQDRQEPRKAISVRELQAWVDEHVRFDHKAPDPMLYPETATTLALAAGRDEKVLPITYEFVVEDSVRTNVKIFGPRSWVRADGEHGSKTCNFAELGLVVAGPRRGETFKICRERKACMVHYGKEIRERNKRAKDAAAHPGKSTGKTAQEKSEERRKVQEAQEEAQRYRWRQAAPALVKCVAAAVEQMPATADGFLATLVIDRLVGMSWRTKKKVTELVRGTTAEDAIRYAAFLILRDEAENEYHGARDFPKRAKALGIDLKAILALSRETADAKVQTSAKPPKKGR